MSYWAQLYPAFEWEWEDVSVPIWHCLIEQSRNGLSCPALLNIWWVNNSPSSARTIYSSTTLGQGIVPRPQSNEERLLVCGLANIIYANYNWSWIMYIFMIWKTVVIHYAPATAIKSFITQPLTVCWSQTSLAWIDTIFLIVSLLSLWVSKVSEGAQNEVK